MVGQEDSSTAAATAYYNNSIVEDTLYQTHQKLIYEQLQNAPSIVDAIILFKVGLFLLPWGPLKKTHSMHSLLPRRFG